ncbi:hypothetical protein SUGI_0670730 [Cryptomeria japonica]|nr:hypothetical protein SUGI_0670730 [Cryptomeria japonica]
MLTDVIDPVAVARILFAFFLGRQYFESGALDLSRYNVGEETGRSPPQDPSANDPWAISSDRSMWYISNKLAGLYLGQAIWKNIESAVLKHIKRWGRSLISSLERREIEDPLNLSETRANSKHPHQNEWP